MTNPFMGQLMVGEGTDEVAGLYTLAHSHSKSTLSLCTNENQPRKCSLFKIDFTKDKIKAQMKEDGISGSNDTDLMNTFYDGVMRGLILNSVESSDDYLCVKIDYNLRLEGTLKVPVAQEDVSSVVYDMLATAYQLVCYQDKDKSTHSSSLSCGVSNNYQQMPMPMPIPMPIARESQASVSYGIGGTEDTQMTALTEYDNEENSQSSHATTGNGLDPLPVPVMVSSQGNSGIHSVSGGSGSGSGSSGGRQASKKRRNDSRRYTKLFG